MGPAIAGGRVLGRYPAQSNAGKRRDPALAACRLSLFELAYLMISF